MLGKRIIPYVASCCFLGLQGGAAWATPLPKTIDNRESYTQDLEARTKKLETELTALQHQITTLKKKSRVSAVVQRSTPSSRSQSTSVEPKIVASVSHPVFLIGTPVVSSPSIGMTTAYDGSDLLVNQPYINEDLFLLKQRQQIFNSAQWLGQTWPSDTPLVNVSGKLEAQLLNANTVHQTQTASNLDLTAAEIDTEVFANKWLTGLIAFVYDNAPSANSYRRIDNSNVFLERAFITVGNLNASPFYGSVGQLYVPFGRYSSSMISDPLTKLVGRTKARALSFGFMKHLDSANDINLSAFVFRGPSRTSEQNHGLRNYGADVAYTFTQPHWNVALGTSYIRNLADSLGMQSNGSHGEHVFAGFATNNETEILQPVAGWDIYSHLSVGPIHLKAEYVTALSAFYANTLSFGPDNNRHGAQPKAFSTELGYDFSIYNRPSTFAIGYSQSQEALALLLPQQRYSATLSTSLWRDTIQSLEFRHDVDYSSCDTATGGSGFEPITGTGHIANTVTLQFGLYF